MNQYIERVIQQVKDNNPNELEFHQTVEEVLTSLEPVIEKHPEYEKESLLERLVEPERIVQFRVAWEDDNGTIQVNKGYRIQFNGALGPYKGGLRFHPSVNLSILKFLAFEQIFKNSLTTLPIGGGKGGSDFNPIGKSDREIMRFCQAFMTGLFRHIGSSVDVPAGDIGVSGKEIGYLFGQYRRLRNEYDNGVITGKDPVYGGSYGRPSATGFGALYYVEAVLEQQKESIKGKTFALSGFGNVAWGCAKKIAELGGKTITISGPNGYVYDPDGVITEEKINYLLEMRASKEQDVRAYAEKFGCQFFPDEKPWGNVKADIYMPCATQNEVTLEDAQKMVENGMKYYFEVSNMPTTNEAMEYLKEHGVLVGPSKAVNAGGVAVSALEMSQNSQRLQWTEEEVDVRLKAIMRNIVTQSYAAAKEYGYENDLVRGANIAGFLKVADAMLKQGIL